MAAQSDDPWFLRQVRAALNSLYDPSVLRHSPLVQLLGLEIQPEGAVAELRRVLTEAIESLQPGPNTPRDSKNWRIYQTLRRRYIEQTGQRETAFDLGISTRQLQREELIARQVLADHLWNAHHVALRQQLIPATEARDDEPASDEDPAPSVTDELDWLKESMPVQTVEIDSVIHDALALLAPLLGSTPLTLEYNPGVDLPPLSLKVPILRQALLDIFSRLFRVAPGGRVSITTCRSGQRILLSAEAHRAEQVGPPCKPESMELVSKLISLCDGELETHCEGPEGASFSVKVSLPITTQAAVLVIDDNADTLQLMQRYLSATRFRFIGTQDAEHGLALASETAPLAILLDVMMPERDGWTVLGQLREHPHTHDIPVIVCSIVSQEQLALALGAAQFLRKPVSRQALLDALDRLPRGSG